MNKKEIRKALLTSVIEALITFGEDSKTNGTPIKDAVEDLGDVTVVILSRIIAMIKLNGGDTDFILKQIIKTSFKEAQDIVDSARCDCHKKDPVPSRSKPDQN